MKIVCVDKGGRNERLPLIRKGSAPKDFFYGSLGLKDEGFEVKHVSSNISYNGLKGKFCRLYETLFNKILNLGIRHFIISELYEKLKSHDVIISFTNGFSLTLGYNSEKLKGKKVIGCFHGLSDISQKTFFLFRFFSEIIIKKSLIKLDHIAFFGPEDRRNSIKKYNLPEIKTSIIEFGVDTKFWKPAINKIAGDYFFSVGQDPNRDFDVLLQTNMDYKIHIHTNHEILSNKNNIIITNGNFWNSELSDIDLKSLYQNSIAVVVPLKDVYQPSGQSVTLQAMSCGKPVILTKTKGIWDSKNLINRYNCLLVKPNSVDDLEKAMIKLIKNSNLRKKIGMNARKTAKKIYGIETSTNSLKKIIKATI